MALVVVALVGAYLSVTQSIVVFFDREFAQSTIVREAGNSLGAILVLALATLSGLLGAWGVVGWRKAPAIVLGVTLVACGLALLGLLAWMGVEIAHNQVTSFPALWAPRPPDSNSQYGPFWITDISPIFYLVMTGSAFILLAGIWSLGTRAFERGTGWLAVLGSAMVLLSGLGPWVFYFVPGIPPDL
jgi:hypothetical protein